MINQPLSVQLIKTAEVKSLILQPDKPKESFTAKERSKIDMWFAICVISTTMLENATKALLKLGVIKRRSGVFELIHAMKALRNHFKDDKDFAQEEIEIDEFIFWFLTMGKEHQKRVMKFQESIINKQK